MGKKSEKKRIKKLKKELLKLEGKKGSKKANKADLSAVGTDLVELGDNASETTAVAVVKPKSTHISRIMPQSYTDVREMAKDMSKAQQMIGPAFRNNPGGCLGIIYQAARWNMDPFALSQEAYLVNGSLGYSGKLIAALIQAHPSLQRRLRIEYDGEIKDKTRCATVTGYLLGEEEPFIVKSPPVKDIDRDGKGSPLWKSDPDQQLAYYTITVS